MLFIVESSTNDINTSVFSDDNDMFIRATNIVGTPLPWKITMEATSIEQKSADNCSPPQGYRLSTAIADHALSGCRYLTYIKHLSQLSL